MSPEPLPDPDARREPENRVERLPLLEIDDMTEHQRRLAARLIEGPRKGVVGPFVPLLYTPRLLEVVEPLGAELRFHGTLDRRVHELVVCLIAAKTANEFEWDIHSRAALDLGVADDQVKVLRSGSVPVDLPANETAALQFVEQLLATNNVDDALFSRVVDDFGPSGVVELTTVAGYFVMACWLINVARTSPAWPKDP